jgi:hypothetical protein
MRPCAAWIGLLLLLLAGCGQPAPAGPAHVTPAPVPERDDASVGSFEATDCFGTTFVAEVPVDAVGPELPPGYKPASLPRNVLGAGPGENNPHLTAFRCAAVRVGNATEADVAFSYAGTLLSGGDEYRWEVFLDEPEPRPLLQLFQHAGWPAVAATIGLSPTAMDVRGNGTHYAVAFAAPLSESTAFDGTEHTSHHQASDGHKWMVEALYTGGQFVQPGTLTAEGGVWSRIASRVGSPSLPGVIQDIHSGAASAEFFADAPPL